MSVLLAVALLGCPAADPPPPPPEPTEAPAPAPTSEMLRLDPGERNGERTTDAATWEEISGMGGLVAHPEGNGIELYATTPYLDRSLAIAFDEGATWTVSADLNRDGRIQPGEFTDLEKNPDGTFDGELRTAVKRGPPIVDVPITIEIGVKGDRRDREFTVRIESSRVGTLPGGIAMHIQSHGGVYDTPRTLITVDEDGDGLPDFGNRLAQFHRSDGLIAARGKVWSYELPADGGFIRVKEAPGAEAPGLHAGSPAPDFSVKASDGETHTLASYAGKMLVLDFWATWCQPCIAVHPRLAELAVDNDLAVLGISADENQAMVNRWLKRHPTEWPTAAIGTESEIYEAYSVTSWPTHALIDPEGKLLALGSFDTIKAALPQKEAAKE